ncbi:ATP-grasp domain-containing protein [Thalassobacillus sp. B23F22_16]|uniref:ATP-grasp domain-containing protein n=1 Tax=Thalassobacillus sp. B23F22_16 TaxID=3459513 RepID=UPI00373E90EF
MGKPNGWIIYNGNSTHEKFYNLVKWIDTVAQEKGLETELIKNNELVVSMENGQSIIKGKHEGKALPDFVIFWDKDIYLANHLEKMGLKLYNSASAIEVCDDKALTHQALAENSVPMPKTVIGPKVFYKVSSFENYEYIADEIGFPMIIKEVFGSFGQQVYLIQDYDEMIEKVKEIGNKAHLFQEMIESSYGKDVRLHVVGGKVVASMLRTSEVDFRANVSNGGKMHRYTPSEAEKQLAIDAAQAVGASFAGVDLLFGANGEPIVCEVNSNAHMKNIYDCTGIDVTEYIIDFILEELKNR